MSDLELIKKNILITDYASYLGYTPIKVGSRYYSLKEHDSVRIDTYRNVFFRNSTGEKGSVIDFGIVFSGKSVGEVIKDLETLSGESSVEYHSKHISPEEVTDNKTLILPEKDKDNKNVFAYLVKTRKIDPEIVKHMMRNRNLYQDTMKNCVFVSYEDDKPIFASKRGTSTYKRFVADVPGSDYIRGQIFLNGKATLVVTESVIDAMSLMTFVGYPDLYDYLSLSGVGKTEPIFHHLKTGRYTNLVLALDNDDAGKEATEKIIEEVKESGLLPESKIEILRPEKKDWNEELE